MAPPAGEPSFNQEGPTTTSPAFLSPGRRGSVPLMVIFKDTCLLSLFATIYSRRGRVINLINR